VQQKKIAILLSTYNGEDYLHEQLESLLKQTYQFFHIYVRDDGSQDRTVDIIRQFQKKFSDRIILLQDLFGNVGVARSFRILLESVEADYYLFSDQDDIWEENKIEMHLKKAKSNESENEPYLSFSNMTIFQQVNKCEYNFFRRYGINEVRIQNGLFQGMVSGCLMFFNNKAKEESLKISPNTKMLHDWNIFISTYVSGRIELLEDSLIKHRLHTKNAIGDMSQKTIIVLLKDFLKYVFHSNKYRQIVLKDYFDFVEIGLTYLPKNIRINKELYNENELDKISYLSRKEWYLKHFNPFIYGNVKGGLILLTI
jgi:glycosyltransferase involved in cell wall biosynthesis